MKRLALKGLLFFTITALPASALAAADLVIATDAPPKSMNPHAYSSDANLSYMSNFFDGLLQRKARMANLPRHWRPVGSVSTASPGNSNCANA